MELTHNKPVKLFAIIILILSLREYASFYLRPDSKEFQDLNDMKIQVNVASEESLRLMPGIGVVTAGRIINERDRNLFHGPQEFEDRVKGIGPSFMMNYGEWLDFRQVSQQRGSGSPLDSHEPPEYDQQ
jgi:hypothetical protein